MAINNSFYSILAQVELDTKNIQNQLNQAAKKVNLKIDADDAIESGKQLGLTFQEANLIIGRSLDVIQDMVDEVYNLDTALTEFKKVSDLSGSALDGYVDKLSKMGIQVARTGKPWCLSRGDGMANQHRDSP